MSTRRLKIESTGDFWRGSIKPQIRLKGNWLNRAGFKPGFHVEIRSNQAGNLTLRAVAHKEDAQ